MTLAGLVAERDRHVAIGIADARGVQAQAQAAQHRRRLDREPRMVLAVAHQHEIGIARRELAERAHGLAQRRADRGAAARDRIGRGVVEALEEQAVVAGQRAEHVGAAGEADQRETMAAVALHGFGEPADRGLGARQAVGRGILGEHAVRDVEQHDHVAAETRHLAGALAPVRLHQRYDQAGERAAQAERAPPAPARAGLGQQPRREIGRDERRERRPPTRERAGVEQQRQRHEQQQPGRGQGLEAHGSGLDWAHGTVRRRVVTRTISSSSSASAAAITSG